MAFGFNFFNKPKQETPKNSVKETAKEIAGDAAKLSAAAIALAGALDASTLEAQDLQKDPTQTKIQQLARSVDSIGHVKGQWDNWEEKTETTKIGLFGALENDSKKLTHSVEFAGVFSDIEKYIIEASKKYDISTDAGAKKFMEHMTVSAFSPMQHSVTNPKLTKKLDAYAKGKSELRGGFNDQKIRKTFRENELNYVQAIVQELISEKMVDINGNRMELAQKQLDDMKAVSWAQAQNLDTQNNSNNTETAQK